MKSKNLKIKVVRDGEEKCNLTFPIYTLKHIESLMPEAVLEKLKEKNFDLSKVLAEVHQSDYAPQTLFEMNDENKSYKVWIV